MLVVFEGGEGAGKSTLIERVAERLAEHGLDIITTFQPGGTNLGSAIRDAIHDPDNHSTLMADALLMAADRHQHAEEVIEPAIEAGKIVLCDRYYYSALAYQGYGSGLDLEFIRSISQVREPDIAILLEIQPSDGFERIKGRDHDKFEKRDISYHERVNRGYFHMAIATEPWWVCSAHASAEVNAEFVTKKILSKLEEKA